MGSGSNQIPVTKPFMPPLAGIHELLAGIWEREWLTNQGPLVGQYEEQLKQYLALPGTCHVFANAGLALQILLKAMGVRGEVITTPFTYVATASCPLWEGCSVRFADIDPETLTLDPAAVEAAITPRTEAIIPTHVFGNACDVEAFAKISARHGIPVIYDAAHAFGSAYKGKSLLECGHASVLSMHATKLVHSVEGGMVHTEDKDLAEKMEWMRRYGHNGPLQYHGVGINAKMSELHAAVGLSVLECADEVLLDRKRIAESYHHLLQDHKNVKFAMKHRGGITWNASYFPVMFNTEGDLVRGQAWMETCGISTRRYFYPTLNTVEAFGRTRGLTVAETVSRRILILPMYWRILEEDLCRVVKCLIDG